MKRCDTQKVEQVDGKTQTWDEMGDKKRKKVEGRKKWMIFKERNGWKEGKKGWKRNDVLRKKLIGRWKERKKEGEKERKRWRFSHNQRNIFFFKYLKFRCLRRRNVIKKECQ